VFRSYLCVLRARGAWTLLVACLLGALSISMVTPGVLLLVQHTTGSLARAGAVSGAVAVGNAAGLVAQGRLIDSYGTTRVLIPAGAGCVTAFTLLTLGAQRGMPYGGLLLLAAVAGSLIPAVLTGVRVLLPELVTGQAIRTAAYALIAVQSQVGLLAGPAIVSAMLVLHKPAVPVIGTGALSATAAFALTSTRHSRKRQLPTRRRRRSWPPAAGLETLLAAGFGTGMAIGLVNAAIPAAVLVRSGVGATWAGPLFMCLAIGDLIGGVAYGMYPWRLPLAQRLTRALCGGAMMAAVLSGVAPWPFALMPLLVGFGVIFAIPGIVSSTLLDVVSAKGELAQSYTTIVAVTLAGSAAGTSAGGVADQAAGPWAAFAFAAMILAAVFLIVQARINTL
jgi:Major Facilitator Superfamily